MLESSLAATVRHIRDQCLSKQTDAILGLGCTGQVLSGVSWTQRTATTLYLYPPESIISKPKGLTDQAKPPILKARAWFHIALGAGQILISGGALLSLE